MTFTYLGDGSTNLDRVRFRIQDTVSGSGPRPSGGNYTDEEINGVIADEGDWERGVAGMYEVMAAEYSKYVDISTGPRKEWLSQAAKQFASFAVQWREMYGAGTSSVATNNIIKVDGYSQDIAADEVT